MKVAVLGGTGAMGGIFGAWLSRGGAEVTLVDVAKPAIEAVNANGLTVEEKDGSTPVFRIPATDRPADVGPVDLIVTFVKCYHTEAAIRAAEPMIGAETAVLSLQNGWGNAQGIADLIGEDRVLLGLTYHSGTLLGPGQVKHPAVGMTYLGELSGETTPRLSRIDEVFRAGGFEITLTPTIIEEVWKKLCLNCAALPPSALLRCVASALVQMDETRTLIATILREVVAVANARGIPLDFQERFDFVTGSLGRAGQARASMLQDVEAGRRTEIEVINGAISAAGREAGIPTPVNDTLVQLVQALQAGYLAKA